MNPPSAPQRSNPHRRRRSQPKANNARTTSGRRAGLRPSKTRGEESAATPVARETCRTAPLRCRWHRYRHPAQRLEEEQAENRSQWRRTPSIPATTPLAPAVTGRPAAATTDRQGRRFRLSPGARRSPRHQLLEVRLRAGGPASNASGSASDSAADRVRRVCSDRLETSGPREEIRDADREKRNDADDRGNRDAEQVQGQEITRGDDGRRRRRRRRNLTEP